MAGKEQSMPVTYEQWALAGLADGLIAAWWLSGSWELATVATGGPVLVLAIITAIAGTGTGTTGPRPGQGET